MPDNDAKPTTPPNANEAARKAGEVHASKNPADAPSGRPVQPAEGTVPDKTVPTPTGMNDTGESVEKQLADSEAHRELVDGVVDDLEGRLSNFDGRKRQEVLDDVSARITSRKVVAAAPRSRMSPSDVESIRNKVPYITPSPAKGEPPVRNTLDNEPSRLDQNQGKADLPTNAPAK